MLKKIYTLLFLGALLSFFSAEMRASHIAGGEITYNCLGGNQYEINLNLFVDCLGFDPGASQTITLNSSCGGSTTVTVNGTNIGGTEISQLCPAQIALSTCNGGTLPGMWIFSYTGIVTLAPPCDTWTASWSTCCRNSAITNLAPTSTNYYIEATLNSATAPCNSSPSFNAQPIPYVCVGQTVNYSYGVIEPDGDSLYYSLIPAMDADGVNSTYNPGFSGTSPIPGITIDSLTGLVTFTPLLTGNFVVVILVEEYDSNGNLVGTVMRDIQFVVQNCTNIVPDPSGGTITSFSGSAVQTGPYSIEMCAGNNFTFSASYSDLNATDVLTYVSNVTAALPGSTISSSGTNPLNITVSWTAPGSMTGTNVSFTVVVEDGACPIMGQQTFVYNVDILDATTVNPDITICGTQGAQLNALGGSIFNWSVVSGPAMTAGNFSCNPCANPVATPVATTTYAVVSDLSGTCDNTDTITVFVVPDFTFSVTQSSANSCLMDPVQLDVTALSPSGTYTFSWSPATNLSDANISNPVATFVSPGTYNYTVSISSSMGCVQTGTASINAAPAFAPQIDATGDTALCAGGTVNLGVEFTGGSTPTSCGLSFTGGCGGTGSTSIIGTGTTTNTTTSYPAVYGNWYKSTKHQFLFTAAELNAAGIVGGKIDQLDFAVTSIAGTTLYKNFSIDMGCTSLTSLSTWQSGLVNVYPPSNTNIIVGWNTYVFTNAFEWDGLSNIIIQVCSDNTSDPGYTQNSSSPYTTTSFMSCIWYSIDFSPACPELTVYGPSGDRPNMRFHNCSIASDPADFTYSWSPASGNIANASAQYTTATPTSVIDFVVTVTNTSGGCTATDTVHVDAINISTLTITPAGPYCVNGTISTLTTSVPPGTGVWSGPGITNVNTGTFDPAIAGVGLHEIIFTVSGACGSGADTIEIDVIPQPDPTITNPGTQCISGAPITIMAASAGGLWTGTGITDASNGTFDPAVAGIGTATITYTITSPCYAQDVVTFNVSNQLDPTIDYVPAICTAALPIILQAADPGGSWSGPGITNSSTGSFDPAAAGSGQHIISYTIGGFCGAMDTVLINVISSPVISLSANITSGCEPTTVTFTGSTNQPGGTCFWNFGDGSTAPICNPTYTYTQAGIAPYDVSFTYTNTTGCSSTVTNVGYITIFSQPVAVYSANPHPTTIVDPTITFTDQSPGIIDTWSWDFGTGITSNLPSPTYTYPDTGLYSVVFIVSNNNGCTDTAYGSIYIEPITTFYVPNAFTPDGNGLNDEFMVRGGEIMNSTFEMRIFNRWGEVLFSSRNRNVGWNGAPMNKGSVVEPGVYIYKITFRDFNGRPKEYLGHVTLVQ